MINCDSLLALVPADNLYQWATADTAAETPWVANQRREFCRHVGPNAWATPVCWGEMGERDFILFTRPDGDWVITISDTASLTIPFSRGDGFIYIKHSTQPWEWAGESLGGPWLCGKDDFVTRYNLCNGVVNWQIDWMGFLSAIRTHLQKKGLETPLEVIGWYNQPPAAPPQEVMRE